MKDVVLVPTFNRPEYLYLCLEHLAAADGADTKHVRISPAGGPDLQGVRPLEFGVQCDCVLGVDRRRVAGCPLVLGAARTGNRFDRRTLPCLAERFWGTGLRPVRRRAAGRSGEILVGAKIKEKGHRRGLSRACVGVRFSTGVFGRPVSIGCRGRRVLLRRPVRRRSRLGRVLRLRRRCVLRAAWLH